MLVHLNHRLAQMSLRLLRAEVWNVGKRKGLKRITARIVPDHLLSTPAIVAHARLVVIGGDSQRLHEEIIMAGGFIKEGKFSRMKVGEIEDALAAATDKEPSAKVKDTLLVLYPKLAPALAQALQARTEDRTAGLQKKLAERATKEAERHRGDPGRIEAGHREGNEQTRSTRSRPCSTTLEERRSSSGTSCRSRAGCKKSLLRSNERRRRSRQGTPTRNPGCSRWL